ncbi:MAG TPA: iron-sulfur cluster assembly accessory protein [Gammaproteobacteria bacterium]|nr:iron-sulfur cluster assembly accessory protein [Gammaproteobacteria bacterium]
MKISMTPAAAEHVKKQLAKQDGALGLRVGVKKSGCSGYAYVLDYAKTLGEGDELIEQHGVKLIVDKSSLEYLDGTQLDYVREGLNSYFKFNNPNATDTCGCGESFSVQ